LRGRQHALAHEWNYAFKLCERKHSRSSHSRPSFFNGVCDQSAYRIAFPMFSWLKPIGILVGSLRPSEPEAFCCKFRWVICH
jgi:hypothetical protein